jgi:hypothetical protein
MSSESRFALSGIMLWAAGPRFFAKFRSLGGRLGPAPHDGKRQVFDSAHFLQKEALP